MDQSLLFFTTRRQNKAKENLAKTEIDRNPTVSMLKAFPTAVSRKGSQHLIENNNKIRKKNTKSSCFRALRVCLLQIFKCVS